MDWNENDMTDKEVQRLSKVQLIEILYMLSQDIERPNLIQNNEYRATSKLPILRSFWETAILREWAVIRQNSGFDTK